MIILIVNMVQEKPDFVSINMVSGYSGDVTELEKLAEENIRDLIENMLEEEIESRETDEQTT